MAGRSDAWIKATVAERRSRPAHLVDEDTDFDVDEAPIPEDPYDPFDEDHLLVDMDDEFAPYDLPHDHDWVTEEDLLPAPKRRPELWRYAVNSLMRYVEANPEAADARRHHASVLADFLAAHKRSGEPTKRDDYLLYDALQSRADNLELVAVATQAARIRNCATGISRPYCGSTYCKNCRTRFIAQSIGAVSGLLRQRYGSNEDKIRSNVAWLTVLSDIVIPVFETAPRHGRRSHDFDAGFVHRSILKLRRGLEIAQNKSRKRLEQLLANKRLTVDLVSRPGVDRSIVQPETFEEDVEYLLDLNQEIMGARHELARLKRRKRSNGLHPLQEESMTRQAALARADCLTPPEIISVATHLEFIGRTFPSVNRLNYPEALALQEAVEKAIKLEWRKINTIYRDLPGVSIIGSFELELVDLRHALGGKHRHTKKAATIARLAGQRSRKRGSVDDDPGSYGRGQLRDEARAIIAKGEIPDPERYPGLRYAVLLHFHAIVDLNGTPRADFETWLRGRTNEGRSERRFKGHWRLPDQVMVQRLHEDRDLVDSLRAMSAYPLKPQIEFNYDLPEDELGDRLIPQRELAAHIWLQSEIGRKGLKIWVNESGTSGGSLIPTRGRKPKRDKRKRDYTPHDPQLHEKLTAFVRRRGREDLVSQLTPPSLKAPPLTLDELFDMCEAASPGVGGDEQDEEQVSDDPVPPGSNEESGGD